MFEDGSHTLCVSQIIQLMGTDSLLTLLSVPLMLTERLVVTLAGLT